ncbi:MAG TPA: DNA repair protein RadC [Longimicrobiaceae bacterium]|nr:DNA repair protein RadC [Longimicrobiaceae bacterium]
MRRTIKHWPECDRPRERARTLGPRALSTRELVALLIETGRPTREGVPARTALELAGDLLEEFAGEDGGDSLRRLMAAPVGAVAGKVPGIGPAKATRVLAALELGRRAAHQLRPERCRLLRSSEVYDRMRFRMRDLDQEEFYVLLLNTQHELMREVFVTRGTLDRALVHPREVFRHAISEQASSVVLVHNHPSGESAPSQQDFEITRLLVEAGDLLGIEVDDHVIVGDTNYYSFKDKGTLRRPAPAVEAPRTSKATRRKSPVALVA